MTKTDMKKNYLLYAAIVVSLILLSLTPVFSYGREDIGTSGAVFLKIGSGARPAGMADVYAASCDDVNSVFHNPAGLVRARDFEFTAQYGAYFQSMTHNALALSKRLSDKIGVLGVGVINLSADKIEKRASDTAIPDSTFSAGDYAYIISFARRIIGRISGGLNAKYIHSAIDDKTAGVWGADVGLTAGFAIRGKDFSSGISVQNIGGELKFDRTGDPLPLTIKGGISSRFLGDRLLVGIEALAPRDNNVSFSFGTEYTQPLTSDFAVSARGGYKSAAASGDEKLGGLAGVTAGASLSFRRRFAFDFAWIPYGILGDTFKYSLSVKF